MSDNPFKKAAEAKKVSPGGKPHAEPQIPVEKPTPTPAENPLAGMIDPKPEGKAYSFYLSAEANENLERLAKQNKCSKSKAVDALLRSLK